MFPKTVFQSFLTVQVLTYFLVSGVNANFGPKKLYEQLCSSSEDCDTSQGLSCQNRACRCDPGGATVYSLSSHRCVGAAGRECVRNNNTEKFCVVNSNCHDYGYMHLCTCKEGFYQSKDGHCYTIAKYGEVCIEEDFSCGDTLSSSIGCMEKKCRCVLGEENQSYDPKENKCTSFAGSQCIFHYHKPCSANSFCAEFNEILVGGASFMAGHKCICSSGFSLTRTKQCLGRQGTHCGANSPCNYDEFLGCLNGICQCRNPLNEIFSERNQRCEILIGSNCKLNDTQSCTENAICQLENNSNTSGSSSKHGKCVCGPGFSPTPASTCLLDINQKCVPGSCNFYNGLTCINDTCNCIDSYLSYDKVSKTCVSLIGLPCGTVSLLHENKEQEVVVLCEAHATCGKGSGPGAHYNGAVKRVCKPSSSKS